MTSERSAVANVASLLARRFYHVGGSVAVPQKCRLAYIGEMFLVRVSVCASYRLSADITLFFKFVLLVIGHLIVYAHFPYFFTIRLPLSSI